MVEADYSIGSKRVTRPNLYVRSMLVGPVPENDSAAPEHVRPSTATMSGVGAEEDGAGEQDPS